MRIRSRDNACAMSIRSEGVQQRAGQRARSRGVFDRYGQLLETLGSDDTGDVRGYLHGFIQPAPAVLGGYLPGRGRAYEYNVCIVVDDSADTPRQSFATVHPPDESMGVEQ